MICLNTTLGIPNYVPPAAHPLDPGAILYNSWGYDQTNVDFYRVTKRSAHFVWIERLHATKNWNACFMHGKTWPTIAAGQYVADSSFAPMRRSYRIYNESFYVRATHGVTRPWDGKPMGITGYA